MFKSDAFLPRPETPLYQRFTESLSTLVSLNILTTNIDEAIEQRFPKLAVFQRSDLSGCIESFQTGKPFIGKLHGSRSAIESAVFTEEDYTALRADTSFINTMKLIFALGTVVFLGYSVSDQYVIDLLSDNAKDMRLFGAGPHFVVSADFKGNPTLMRISYSLKRFPDHRSALTVLDIIREVEARKAEISARIAPENKPPDSVPSRVANATAYFISDFVPPGTWNTSTTAKFLRRDGVMAEMTVGLGFTNGEVPFNASTAAHDLVVGLICFDIVYFSLTALHKVHQLLGSEIFWEFVHLNVIRFVHSVHEPAFISEEGALIGDTGLVSISEADGTPQAAGPFIRRQLTPAPGKETLAEKLFEELEKKTVVFDKGDRMNLASLVRASVMMPGVARLIGIGEAILPSQAPRWLMFPYLRMAHLVHTGVICDELGIQAAKIPFGSSKLTSAAFGVQAPAEWAEQYASYALSGRFYSDLGEMVLSQPSILKHIVTFRNTTEGESFRMQVREQLLGNDASEFSASINAGLKRNIPIQILEKARQKCLTLFTEKASISPVPAVWTNSLLADDSTKFWRARSRKLFLDLAEKRGISKEDPCLCGSGEKLRRCCLAPLQD